MCDNLKERLTDMSVLASTRTPADALKYIEELEAENAGLKDKLAKAVEMISEMPLLATYEDHVQWSKATLAELTGGKDE